LNVFCFGDFSFISLVGAWITLLVDGKCRLSGGDVVS